VHGERPPAWELRGLKEKRGWAGCGERREEREKAFPFSFKFFSNSFFKLSNFNQTEIHAFKS
jgi:hypothetical protein